MMGEKMSSFVSFLVVVVIGMISGSKTVDAVRYYTVLNEAESTPGGRRFDVEVTRVFARETLREATNMIWYNFRQFSASDRRDPYSIFFTVKDFEGVAHAYSNRIDLSVRHLASYHGDLKSEVKGIIYHEMTHLLQWSGGAQGWVIEGVADFIRLRARLPANNWASPGDGKRWDDPNSSVTARFFDYLEYRKGGFVAYLNGRLKTGYSDTIFSDFFGKNIAGLWADYKRRYGREL